MNDATELTEQGLTAARVGDIEKARLLLTKATKQTPHNIEAWLGLAGVVESMEAKKDCFTKILDIDPDNSGAIAGLRLIEEKLGAVEKDSSGLLFCTRHPTVETGLSCNRCDKPICPKCAIRTPVGFRCPDCIREQEDKFYSGSNTDYIITVIIALPLSIIISSLFIIILNSGGFFLLIIGFFVAPAACGLISEAVRWGVGRRRSRYLSYVVATCLVIATVPFILLLLLKGDFFGLLAPALLLFLGVPTIMARLR